MTIRPPSLTSALLYDEGVRRVLRPAPEEVEGRPVQGKRHLPGLGPVSPGSQQFARGEGPGEDSKASEAFSAPARARDGHSARSSSRTGTIDSAPSTPSTKTRSSRARSCESAKVWSGKRESNPRHPPWQGGALPLSYSRPGQKKQEDSGAGRGSQGAGAGREEGKPKPPLFAMPSGFRACSRASGRGC